MNPLAVNGTRVKLRYIVGNYPMGAFERGLTGTVERIDTTFKNETIAYVRLDKLDDRLEDWDNCMEVGSTPELWLTTWEDWEPEDAP